MNGPDGLEERTFDAEEYFEQRELAADRLRDEEWDGFDELNRLPVPCVVLGHDFHPWTHHCRRCGFMKEGS